MAYGEALLSKIIDSGNVTALKRYDIRAEHFGTEVEREAYRFIIDYAESNGGRTPDYRTVAAEVDGFTYVPNVSDSIEWLATQLKNRAALRKWRDVLQEEVVRAFTEADEKNDPSVLEKVLQKKLEDITIGHRTGVRLGTDIKRDTEKFIEEYRRRKAGESTRVWQSHFPSINNEIGGYTSGNMYTWFGRSGRGKSVIVLEEAIEAAMQGANVLIWSMEMSWYEVLVRIYVSISGREAIIPRKYLNIDMDAGFNARDVRQGRLSEDFERGFETFLSTISELVPGNIIVRAVDDEDFGRRDLRQLESDILAVGADVVVLDPFYYMDYERNSSKTAGGDAAETSKKLRRLAGRTKTVIHAITQAEEDAKEGTGEDRELLLPKRADVKKTKQLLEDAANLFAIDTVYTENRGLIGLGKGRDGGEGKQFEIVYLPQYGIVREISTDEKAAEQFGF